MKIAQNCVVAIHYTLTNEEGQELDSSKGQDPLVYLHGGGNIIPGLEKALEGAGEGDELSVTIQPEDGYGDFNPELVQLVPSESFEGVDEVKPGMQFHAAAENGQQMRVVVQEVSDEGVLIDANHPLAGQVLNFAINVQEIREASAEELQHGHAHGPGGHHH